MSSSTPTPATPPPALEPPFRGYIETTFDALLVFEAARRGMIPRVTRRLIDRERGMVQSGAIFVFDEHESGIKRWTDGLIWSPSRILGNFLVYRETDKRSNNPPTPMSTAPRAGPSDSPSGSSSSSSSTARPNTGLATPPIDPPILGGGALTRPRSASEGGAIDRNRERQLVGSLTTSYRFKESGLVKKTMSVHVNGFAQHMISYYTIEDVLSGKLRSPATVPELASLEISSEYLMKQNFRFPPMVEVGPDGVMRYRGEPEEPTSPSTPMTGMSIPSFPGGQADSYDPPPYAPHPQGALRLDSSSAQRHRAVTVPMPISIPHPHGGPAPGGFMAPSSAESYYEPHSAPNPMHHSLAPSLVRQGSTGSGPMRPSSGSRRYLPYASSSSAPQRLGVQMPVPHHRRQSQPVVAHHSHHQHHPATDMYSPIPYNQDVKPVIPGTYHHYQPPQTAPGSFSDFYGGHPPPLPPPLQPTSQPHHQQQHQQPQPQVQHAHQIQSPLTSPTAYTATPTSVDSGSGGMQTWSSGLAPNNAGGIMGGSIGSGVNQGSNNAPRMSLPPQTASSDGSGSHESWTPNGHSQNTAHQPWVDEGRGHSHGHSHGHGGHGHEEPTQRWEGQSVAQ